VESPRRRRCCPKRFGECQAVYEDFPGWKESTVGISRAYEDLPAQWRAPIWTDCSPWSACPITIIFDGDRIGTKPSFAKNPVRLIEVPIE